MATVNERLQDGVVDHEVNFRRWSAGVVQRIIALLNRSDASLAAQLAQALLALDHESFTVQRLDSLLTSVRQVNAAAYRAVLDAMQAEMRNASQVEAAAQSVLLRRVVPHIVQVRFPVAAVSPEHAYAAALARPFQGRLLKEWAANLDDSRMALIRNTVRQGFVQGQTASDIIRRIRGTKALRYGDGILNRPRSELAAVVNTALSHTAQTVRQQSYDANGGMIKALKWVSTLDNRTTPACRIRDGLQYTPDTHAPIGHSVPWGAGPGRLHFNCRSVSVPVLKSWRELGVPIDDMPPGTRASMDGQVPADMTYAQWFAKQSAARQDEIVGPARGLLYRQGKVTFDQFYTPKGNWLTLDQLMQKIR